MTAAVTTTQSPSFLEEVEATILQHLAAAAAELSQLPPSRQNSMVRTKLDEARLWLKAEPV